MLTSADPTTPTGPRSRATRQPAVRAIAGLLLMLGLAVSGCTAQARASSGTGREMELATAYIGAPVGSDVTDAYLVIRNTGATANRLVSVRTSAGGTVTMRGPGPRGPQEMRAVTSIRIPADSLVRLRPNSFHLVVTGARKMKQGTDITLTLTFAHGGSYRVPAQVTSPQSGGSSYFLN